MKRNGELCEFGHTPPSARWADTSHNLGEEPRGDGRGKVGGVWEKRKQGKGNITHTGALYMVG